jgi:triacylglycerol esterase/lipase EstA (alpha/beta hydrolase family)
MLAAWLVVIVFAITVITGFAGVLVVIAVVVTASFVIAAINASARPPESRLGLPRRVVLWGREIVVAWLVMLWFMPFERWLMRRAIKGARTDLSPVLLIHGYVNNAGALFILWRAIKGAGHGVYTLNLEPVYADIDSYADLIDTALAHVQQAEGGRQVALVCHSMGGLAARAYLRRHGGARVAKVVTLGTPHAGTALAHTALGENGRQMRIASPWLQGLARHEHGVWGCPVVSVFSRDDNIVAPQLSAQLEGARNIALTGVGHISLPMTQSVARLVIAELAAMPGVAASRPDPV